MRFYLFCFCLALMILYAQRVTDGRATRPVKYEYYQESLYVDSITMTMRMRITKVDAQ